MLRLFAVVSGCLVGLFYLGAFVCFVVLKWLVVLGSLLCLVACFRHVGCCRFSITFAVLWSC